MFKVGDKVKFTYFDGDEGYFEMDKVYTVDDVVVGLNGPDSANIYLVGIKNMFAWESQLKLVVEDNAINRLLYPEYKIVNGYLEEDDV